MQKKYPLEMLIIFRFDVCNTDVIQLIGNEVFFNNIISGRFLFFASFELHLTSVLTCWTNC